MTASYDLITLGETMLRLNPPQPQRLGQSHSLELSFGGTESNVAANLARLGRRVSWWSRLPDNPLGRQLVQTLRGHGVYTDAVLFVEGERLGIYFVEHGKAPRGVQVWYDRADSAASHMQPDDVPESWLASGRWLHLTGITPALGGSCNETARRALDYAKSQGVVVSFDVNYRALLWSPEAAAQALAPFCQAADVVFIARRDAEQLFGIMRHTAEGVAQALHAQWGDTVIVTDGDAGSVGSDGRTLHRAPALQAEIVDRIGAGDAFASGVIDRLLEAAPLAEALRYGAALAALKLTIPGDVALVSRADVQRVLDASSRSVQR